MQCWKWGQISHHSEDPATVPSGGRVATTRQSLRLYMYMCMCMCMCMCTCMCMCMYMCICMCMCSCGQMSQLVPECDSYKTLQVYAMLEVGAD